MVKEINKNTKQAQYYIDRYARSTKYTLDDVYKNCSIRKERVYEMIRQRHDVDAMTLKIIGANCSAFTVGYFLLNEPNTLAVQTATNIYLIKLTEDEAYDIH